MSILNHPIPSKGQQPLLPARSSAAQDAHHHLAIAQPGSSKKSSLLVAGVSVPMMSDMFQNGLKMPHMEFLCSLSENEQFVRIDEAAGNILDRYASSSKPSFMLSVSVSSAVKLDTRQIELIARKMQKLTGFRDLRLQNIVDPSLIAGFVICYGDDESSVIDLSVKGQLAMLAARVESSEQRSDRIAQSWNSPAI